MAARPYAERKRHLGENWAQFLQDVEIAHELLGETNLDPAERAAVIGAIFHAPASPGASEEYQEFMRLNRQLITRELERGEDL